MPGKIPPATPLDRRNMLRAAALGSAGMIVTASARDANAEDTRLRPNTPGDQTAALQKAIDNAARAGTPLVIPPGTYRAGKLTLPDGAHQFGVLQPVDVEPHAWVRGLPPRHRGSVGQDGFDQRIGVETHHLHGRYRRADFADVDQRARWQAGFFVRRGAFARAVGFSLVLHFQWLASG